MIQEAFTKLDSQEAKTLLDEINPELEGTALKEEEAVIMAQDISFYPGYRFLDISNQGSTTPAHRYVLYKKDDIVVLDWSSTPIYNLNQRLPVRINESNATNYARFFFSCVQGKKGRFLLIENVDDIVWAEEPPVAVKRVMGEKITPLAVVGTNENGYILDARFLFDDCLFKAQVQINNEGTVSVFNEELLVEDMPVQNDILAI